MLHNKKIVLGVSASIAAYKAPELVRQLIKAGAQVQVILTPAAAQLVSPLALATVSKHPVKYTIADADAWNNHVALSHWADVLLIAPASCNTIAKMCHGLCDNLLLAVYLSAKCTIMVAPAMDDDMYHHASTQHNINTLKTYGHYIIPTEYGELASGLVGQGRMAMPEHIVTHVHNYFALLQDLAGKHILITAGPTYEALDPVRYIGNHSSGKMGVALAQQATQRGAKVTLILGPTQVVHNLTGIHVVHVQSAAQMYDAAVQAFAHAHIAILSAAVADYTPVQVASEKIKKNDDTFSLALTKTKDILKELGHTKKAGQIVVGFALETNNEKAYALKKLVDKKADYIVLNSLNDAGAAFGTDTNKVTIYDTYHNVHNYELKHKNDVANDILNVITLPNIMA